MLTKGWIEVYSKRAVLSVNLNVAILLRLLNGSGTKFFNQNLFSLLGQSNFLNGLIIKVVVNVMYSDDKSYKDLSLNEVLVQKKIKSSSFASAKLQTGI